MTRLLSHSILILLSFIFLLPFGWIASLAFKRQIDILMTNIISPISYGNFVKLFASKSFKAPIIFSLREFCFIQSNLPPMLEVGETLYLSAAKSKPLSFIALLIS